MDEHWQSLSLSLSLFDQSDCFSHLEEMRTSVVSVCLNLTRLGALDNGAVLDNALLFGNNAVLLDNDSILRGNRHSESVRNHCHSPPSINPQDVDLALPSLPAYQVFAMAGESYTRTTNPTPFYPELNPYTGGKPQPCPPGVAYPQVPQEQGYYLMSSAAPPLPQYPPRAAAPPYPPQTAAPSQAQYPPGTAAATYHQGSVVENSHHENLPRQQPQAQYVQQQPMAQPAMTIKGSGGNRNLKNLPVGPNGREWSNGLCRCCDQPSTCQCGSLILFFVAVSH